MHIEIIIIIIMLGSKNGRYKGFCLYFDHIPSHQQF